MITRFGGLQSIGRPAGTFAQVAGLLLLALFASALVGLLSAVNQLFAIALGAALVLPLALFAPRLLFWTSLLGPLLIVGLLELYLPGLQALRHLFPVAAALFFVAALTQREQRGRAPAGDAGPIAWAVGAFLTVAAASSLFNWSGPLALLAGVKNYFQVWGLLLGLLVLGTWPGLERRVARAIFLVALVQLPFVLHQFLFLVPKRLNEGIGVAVDVVAGTLGGSVFGGGQNAFLALVLSTVAGVVVSMWRHGVVSTRRLWLILPVLLLPLLLNSSRISAVYAVVVFLFIFRKELLRRPLRFMTGGLILVLTGTGLLFSYLAIDQRQYGKRFDSIGQLIDHVTTAQVSEDKGYGGLELNRTTALTFWAREASRYPMAKVLFGHGLSAAKAGEGKILDTSRNLASVRYPGMGIGVTAASALLWDLGVFGLLAGLSLPLAAYVTAGRLARRVASSPFHVALFEGLQAACLLLTLSLLHKASFTFHLGYQTFFCILLGLLAYLGRHLSPAAVSNQGRPTVGNPTRKRAGRRSAGLPGGSAGRA